MADATKYTAKVRVMRSYDYNHFEVELGTTDALTIDGVNELRKTAAVLVDEAVRQYREAKVHESCREYKNRECERMLEQVQYIKGLPQPNAPPSKLPY
jgi:hypothetical protein